MGRKFGVSIGNYNNVFVFDEADGFPIKIKPLDGGSNPFASKSLIADVLGRFGATSSAGGGDVNGPASAVDNRVVFFDGTTGKLIKDSGLTLSGSNTGDQTTSTISGISAAAATVLDDATVAAMVETLFGAASTGSNGAVRSTSPTLVTPTLGAALATSIDFGNGAVTDLFGAAFTPTLTNTTNVSSSSQLRAVAIRVNDVVAVGQAISVTPTAGSANTVVDSTLPYASAMTNAGDLIGVGSCFVSTSFVGVRVLGETTGDLARFNFTSNGTGAHTLFILYLYRIL